VEVAVFLGQRAYSGNPVHSLKIDTGANRRSDDTAQLRLSTMLRVGSNNIARRFRSCVDNAR
jgi:hypothetical protein